MENEPIPKTTWSLIEGLNGFPSNREGWGKFVERYGPVIMNWCRRWGLQDDDAADLTQDVLMRFPGRLRKFEYDPERRFRDYLRAAVKNALVDFNEKRGRPGAGSGDTQVHDVLANVEAKADLMRRLDDTFDREILEVAMAQVRARVGAATWEAFRRTAIEKESAADVAAALGMTVGAVHQACCRVKGMVRKALKDLEAGSDE